MAVTGHGHHIPDSGDEEKDAKVKRDRCGGVQHCRTCRKDVAAYREANPPLAADPGKVDLIEWDIDANRPAEVRPRPSGLERDLAELLNRHSEENESGTPDFILAGFLIGVLDAYNKTLGERAVWRGESVELPALQRLHADSEQMDKVIAFLRRKVKEGVVHITEPMEATDIYRELMDYTPPEKPDLEQGGLEAGDTLGPIDDIDDKEVPLVIYTHGQRNEIGTAKLHVTPGETHVSGTITGALPIFGSENLSSVVPVDIEEPKDEPPPTSRFSRYMQQGLTKND